jgi:cytoskeletal protein RodZ
MGTFGESLRRERETRGITLEDISKATKISVRLLQAIENEDFSRLPGGVFNVNFVRQYARHAGMDEDRVVSEFRALTTEPAEAAAPVSPTPEYDWDAERRGRIRTWATAAVVVIGVAVGAYLWMQQKPAEPAPTPAPPPVVVSSTPPPPEPKVEPPPPTPKVEAPAPLPAAAQPDDPNAPVRVELVATEMVWVTAAADGKPVFTTTLQAEQKRVATAQERVRIRVGNAGAIKAILNGQEQPPIGPAGHPRTVVFTPEGMHVVQPPPPEENPQKETPP